MKVKYVTCPFCEVTFEENCEYVDVGVGFIQCSPNFCEGCRSWEKYPDDDGTNPKCNYKGSWAQLICEHANYDVKWIYDSDGKGEPYMFCIDCPHIEARNK